MPERRSPTQPVSPRPQAPRRSRGRAAPLPLDLALQGGGSHGAFTWGVLDHLLAQESVQIAALSGTSAGALNAAVLATGLAEGGRDGARAVLQAFWMDVSDTGRCFGASLPSFMAPSTQAWTQTWAQAWAPLLQGWRELGHWFSPSQLNPLGLNPLRDVVQRHVRLPALHRADCRLFITATAVRSGRPRVFTGRAVTHDVLLASACLPQLFAPVTIDGEAYWDGGYSGNPALWPLIYHTEPLDLLLIKVNPLRRDELPDSAEAIAERVNEITFNAGLVSELRAIAFVQKLVGAGKVSEREYKNLRLHMVADEDRLAGYGSASKLWTQRAFLLELRDLGRQAAGRWWQAHHHDLGRRATLDIASTWLDAKAVEGLEPAAAPLKPAAVRGGRPRR